MVDGQNGSLYEQPMVQEVQKRESKGGERVTDRGGVGCTLEKRLVTRPKGVPSKKAMGARSTAASSARNSVLPAFQARKRRYNS